MCSGQLARVKSHYEISALAAFCHARFGLIQKRVSSSRCGRLAPSPFSDIQTGQVLRSLRLTPQRYEPLKYFMRFTDNDKTLKGLHGSKAVTLGHMGFNYSPAAS